MSEEYGFLDELLCNLPSQTHDLEFHTSEAINHVDSSRNDESELEVKLRKEIESLKKRNRLLRQTLNEREARLTELLKEKMSMTEEQERIENWERKLEEANAHKEATKQLNKQLFQLSQERDNVKISMNSTIKTLKKKSASQKIQIDRKEQQLFQEKKRRLKQLKVIVELSEILISVGLLPAKYKRSLDGWKFEVHLSEDGAKGEDVEEKVEEEELRVKNSSPKSIAQVMESKSIEPPKVMSIVQREEDQVAILSDSESSGNEGCKTSSPPAWNHPPSSALVIDSVKSLHKHLVSSEEDAHNRSECDFGSTLRTPCSSVSVGMGINLSSKGPSGNQELSHPTSSEGKSLTMDSGRMEKSVTLSSEEEEWHWDESSEKFPPASSSGVSQTDQETGSVSIKKNEEESKESRLATDSSDNFDVQVLLMEMLWEVKPMLEPFEMEDDDIL